MKYQSIIRFIIIGGSSTLIDFAIYMIISNYIDIAIAKAISMTIAAIFSFIFNRKWTFNNTGNTNIVQITKYILCQLVNIIVNSTTNSLFYSVSNNKLISFVIATGCAMIVNYMLQKMVVFKEVRK